MGDYEFYYTQDGSIGLFSYDDNDVYHSKYGALSEAWEKFVLPSGIDDIINTKKEINVLDVCYGIGYNTKALMSYVINKNEKFLRITIWDKFKIFFIKNKKKLLKKFLKKNRNINNIETLHNDNQNGSQKKLSIYNDTINSYNFIDEKLMHLSHFNIDCMEINPELVKISPLLKTIITPQELYTKIVPQIFDCFETYWRIKRFLIKISMQLDLRNKPNIIDLLNLKFEDNFLDNRNKYKIHKFVNYILIDSLIDKYKDRYFDKNIKLKFKNKKLKKYFDKKYLKYTKFKLDNKYNLLTKLNLLGYLHNIYYEYQSKRYKKAKFNLVRKLFNLNFHVDDARQSILKIDKKYDYMFLDAFTYSKAPELWTIDFIAELTQRLSENGLILTYSNSALIRNTFIECGLYIGKIVDSKTGKSIGTIATKNKSLIKTPLTNMEMGLCATKAGIPYRDASLSSSREAILKRHEEDFKNSDLITSSKYFKTRGKKKEENDE